jgi:biopolymer transport protein TolQ
MHDSLVQLIWQSSLLVKLVLLTLVVFSVVSWAIIFQKGWLFSAAAKESDAFLKTLAGEGTLPALAGVAATLRHSPLANLFRSVHEARARGHQDEIKRVLRRAQTSQTEALHAYLPFLATIGSTAPFIGLFGTVWGIMNAFREIGQAGSASLAVVAPGIAEALVTTAAGLAAAIPAVIAYNHYINRVRSMAAQMDDVSEELVALLSRRSG